MLPGCIWYANDNIDINEETVNGKGTFHASQTVAFRRRVLNKEPSEINIPYNQARSLKVPQNFHNFASIKYGHREDRTNIPSSSGI